MIGINEDTPTFVISTLDEQSCDRVSQVKQHLQRAGFRHWQIIQAKTPETENFEGVGLPPILQGRWRTDLQHMWGSAACTLSHIQFYDRPDSELPIIVLEDDVTIHPNFFQILDAVNFPDQIQWDLCHLSYFNSQLGSQKNPTRVVAPHLIQCAPNQVAGAYSYIVNRSFLERFTPLVEEVDCQLAHLTDEIASYVIEHEPKLTAPDFRLDSVRMSLDHVSWHQNNPTTD
ncbi:glycosyltransferase family 25 protein [Rhodopirellula bahusiensis]|uniref:Beta-1,4-galactosyltransferase n=1 Tax=Rhodopirellula bahusiensis TaxID=2014065 RepID=A0A2G1W6R3_9BACT|nr:glycosyltransferase family 25 protein [Rhodopirellula bahusiensis]PHQ34733.1 beta-1,4-galactosyltransferase [Rhodopirellula bahusiensis]